MLASRLPVQGVPAHGLWTPIDIELDSGRGAFAPPTRRITPHFPSMMGVLTASSGDTNLPPPSTPLKNRHSTSSASGIQEATRRVSATNASSADKRGSITELVGGSEPESPTAEAAKFGGRVVQREASGNWVVYDYPAATALGQEM